MRVAAFLLVLLSASIASAQEETYLTQFCARSACFSGEDSCERYRSARADEGHTEAACRPVAVTWRVTWVDRITRDEMVLAYTTRGGCEGARRNMQRANRRRPGFHLYEGISECVELRTVPVPPPPDSDGDGLNDREDHCPAAAGTVARFGCPDSDADGVVDALDLCPREAEDAGQPLVDDGCPAASFCFTLGGAPLPTCRHGRTQCEATRTEYSGLMREPSTECAPELARSVRPATP